MKSTDFKVFEYKVWKNWFNVDDTNVMDLVINKLQYSTGPPGGRLTYTPPRMVSTYGKGKWERTSWTAGQQCRNISAVAEPRPIPDSVFSSGLMNSVKRSITECGGEVTDETATGLWCNYYSSLTHHIAAHTDAEPYYALNSGQTKLPLFVSLTVYKDGKYLTSPNCLARFQIKTANKKWITVALPHMSLLVMSGTTEHRVLKPLKKQIFRQRYNITFRTPVSYATDPLGNYRFFANCNRYYNFASKLVIHVDSVNCDKIEDFSLDVADNKYKNESGTEVKVPKLSETTEFAIRQHTFIRPKYMQLLKLQLKFKKYVLNRGLLYKKLKKQFPSVSKLDSNVTSYDIESIFQQISK